MLFVCGDDDGAKAQAVELLGSFGRPRERVLDLGNLAGARAAAL